MLRRDETLKEGGLEREEGGIPFPVQVRWLPWMTDRLTGSCVKCIKMASRKKCAQVKAFHCLTQSYAFIIILLTAESPESPTLNDLSSSVG